MAGQAKKRGLNALFSVPSLSRNMRGTSLGQGWDKEQGGTNEADNIFNRLICVDGTVDVDYNRGTVFHISNLREGKYEKIGVVGRDRFFVLRRVVWTKIAKVRAGAGGRNKPAATDRGSESCDLGVVRESRHRRDHSADSTFLYQFRLSEC